MTSAPSPTPVLSLATPAAWHTWLRTHHARSTGVFLRLVKTSTERSGKTRTPLSYATALEVALAWGWIDGQKRALDAGAWLQRFTPRTPRSGWSKINRAKAEALIAAGTMEAPGLAEVERARKDGRWDRAYDGARAATVPSDLAHALARDPRATAFFEKLDSANRYAILYRLQTAKRPETRARRLQTFIEMCARHETLHPPRKTRA
ncbi:MAG TPA: YdeI/OmpD-associated family protein [Polyangia bacterium]|nr:YdeI/OmpD-associated family protein [Polyangia bacterium]